jgi:ankyrin repeat protein
MQNRAGASNGTARAVTIVAALLAGGFVTVLDAGESPDAEIYTAIRNNDLARLRSLLSNGVDPNIRDGRGTTPLMHAAAIGSIEALKLLLTAGADPNSRDAFDVPPLTYGIRDVAKVRLLLDAGAEANSKSKQEQTALLVAAANPGSIDVVRLLVAKGADPKERGPFGRTALILAADANDIAMVRFFLDKGLDVNATNRTDKLGHTALMAASGQANVAIVRLLLERGADVNAATTTDPAATGRRGRGPLALKGETPLTLAAPYGSPALVRLLLKAGANANARDGRGMTPLMLAVASENQDPRVVKMLLGAGAESGSASIVGETAFDWACKFGSPPVLKLLRSGNQSCGKSEAGIRFSSLKDLRSAVETSLAIVQRSATRFFNETGCVSCHHQNLTTVAVSAAREARVGIDEAAAAEQRKLVITQFAGLRNRLLQRLDPGGGLDLTLWTLSSLAADKYPPDQTTDAMASYVMCRQLTDGRWPRQEESRSPINDGDFARIALGIQAMRAYGAPALDVEIKERIGRARSWLMAAHSKTTDDRAMLLLGLQSSGADEKTVRAAATALLALQRGDGGWAPNPSLESDAYATSEALSALYEAGVMQPREDVYQRGVRFLLETRHDDGSWHVRSRAPKFQPYFESGFPYGHDQWISVAATARASAVLARALPREGE